MIHFLARIFVLPLGMFMVFGCASSGKYVNTKKLEIKQKETKQGTVLVLEQATVQAEKNVIEKSTNVKTVSKITSYDLKNKDKEVFRFDVNPDGDRIVMMVYERTGGDWISQLWATGKDGGSMTKVTSGNYKDEDPRYSMDGSFIYFVSNRGDENQKVWRIQSSGLGGLTKVTSGSTIDRSPCVSPQNDEVIYGSLMAGSKEWQIWKCTDKGALPTQMTVGFRPVFSPDGSRVLFVRNNDDTGKSDLWVMDADGSSQTKLSDSASNEKDPRWSPTGKHILFASDSGRDEEKKNNFDIYLMQSDGSTVTQLTTNGSYDDLPVFSPDGRHIYFRSNRGGVWNIWRMELAVSVD